MKIYDDIDTEKYTELEDIAYKTASKMLKEGFTKEAIYTFLHTTVGVGLYYAECDYVLKGE